MGLLSLSSHSTEHDGTSQVPTSFTFQLVLAYCPSTWNEKLSPCNFVSCLLH